MDLLQRTKSITKFSITRLHREEAKQRVDPSHIIHETSLATNLSFFSKYVYALGTGGKVWQGLNVWPLWEDVRGCPTLNTAGSSQLQWIHQRTQLSLSAGDASGKMSFRKGKISYGRERSEEKTVSETVLQTPLSQQKERKEVLQALPLHLRLFCPWW